jgi:hypothetical protein
MPAEKLVLFAARAVCALNAANYQHGHSHSHEDGQHIRVHREPMDNAMHKPQPISSAARVAIYYASIEMRPLRSAVFRQPEVYHFDSTPVRDSSLE